jgi:hypothetical protein
MSVNGQIIQNAALGTYADLEGPTFVPGSNLIVYNLNQVNGTRNQNVLLFIIAQPHIVDFFSYHLVEIHPC